ncbi:MAG TPA: NADH-quinone oxidoreductase subunit D [Elusimicrobia bacterium]|nr:NADH-quinone oxidoreductase subunit D [Elusimicrobiota bacterium]
MTRTPPAVPTRSAHKTDQLFVNMGPQHPSTHGVLRVGLTIEGEVIVKAEPDIGYLHRGTEKLLETRTYPQGVVFSDRWDYCSAMTNNLAFSLAVERLMGVQAPPRADALRVIHCELQRIASHLLFVGTYGIDIGAATPFLHTFREREMILDLFEMSSGARLTYNHIRIGGVAADITPEWAAKAREFLAYFKPRLCEYDTLLTYNPIFLDRTQGIGVISAETALAWGLSGPNLRASGVPYDVRKWAPHCGYEGYPFEMALGKAGDCFDRYHCRVREMRESAKIVEAALEGLPEGEVMAKIPKLLKPAPGEAYAHVEGSRGDLGIYVVSDGTAMPYRLHVRAPSFANLAIVQELFVGQKLADVIAMLGSLDIVLGEVDR